VLAGLRGLLMEGWTWRLVGQALLAILAVGAVSQTLAFLALRGRVKQR